jgi:putative membrane protein
MIAPYFTIQGAAMDDTDDPRIFFAAERSLLAWNRTCLAMMGFGFVIERFGLFLRLMDPMHAHAPRTGASFWVGMALMVFSALLACLSTLSFRTVVRRLTPHQIPSSRFPRLALVANLGVAAAGLALTVYLALAAQ